MPARPGFLQRGPQWDPTEVNNKIVHKRNTIFNRPVGPLHLACRVGAIAKPTLKNSIINFSSRRECLHYRNSQDRPIAGYSLDPHCRL